MQGIIDLRVDATAVGKQDLRIRSGRAWRPVGLESQLPLSAQLHTWALDKVYSEHFQLTCNTMAVGLAISEPNDRLRNHNPIGRSFIDGGVDRTPLSSVGLGLQNVQTATENTSRQQEATNTTCTRVWMQPVVDQGEQELACRQWRTAGWETRRTAAVVVLRVLYS